MTNENTTMTAAWHPYRGEYVVERGRFARAAYVVSTTPTRALVAIPQKGNGRVMLSWRGFDKLRAEESRDILNVRDAASALRAWLASDKGAELAAELARVRAAVFSAATGRSRMIQPRASAHVKRCVAALRETRAYLARFTSEALPVLSLDLDADPCEDETRAARTERGSARISDWLPFFQAQFEACLGQGFERDAAGAMGRKAAADYLRATRERRPLRGPTLTAADLMVAPSANLVRSTLQSCEDARRWSELMRAGREDAEVWGARLTRIRQRAKGRRRALRAIGRARNGLGSWQWVHTNRRGDAWRSLSLATTLNGTGLE